MAESEDIMDEQPQKKPKNDIGRKKGKKKKNKKSISKKVKRLKLIREQYLAYTNANNIKRTRNWFAEVANIYKSIPVGLSAPIVEGKFALYFNQYSKNPSADPNKVIEDEIGDIEIGKDAEPKHDYVPFFPWFSINTDPRNSVFFTSVAKEVIFICRGEFQDVNVLVPMDEYDTFCTNVISYCRANGYNESPIIDLALLDIVIQNNIQAIPVYEITFDNRINDYADAEIELGGFGSTDIYLKAVSNGSTQVTMVANRKKKEKEEKEQPVVEPTEPKEENKPKKETREEKEARKVEKEKRKIELEKQKLKVLKEKNKLQKEKLKKENIKLELQKLKEINKLVAQLTKAGLPQSEIQSIIKRFQ